MGLSKIFTGIIVLINDMLAWVRREIPVLKVFSVTTLVLIPLLWGVLMVPILDFLEYIILKVIRKSHGSV